ncbi:hypothetical protein HDZ31DRAFT_81890 [Schizophyllum fasciatum]
MNFKRGFLNSDRGQRSISQRNDQSDQVQSDAFVFPEHVHASLEGQTIPVPKFDLMYATFPARPAAPSADEERDGWCEALVDSTTARTVLASLTANPPARLPRNAAPVYRIGPVEGKGLGMLATRDLAPGDLIVAERPLTMAPVGLPPSADDFPDGLSPTVTMRELAGAQFKAAERHFEALARRMTPERRAAFEALSNCHEGDGSGPLMGRFRTNGIGMPNTYRFMAQQVKMEVPYSIAMNDISRANHSCRPNAHVFFDEGLFASVLRPVRPIKAGEEIFISYTAGLELYKERKASLASYGFECSCQSCTDPAASDARRMQIATFSSANQYNGGPKVALKTILGRIALMRKEGLEEMMEYKTLYIGLETVFRMLGDKKRAADARRESDQISWALYNQPGLDLPFF